MAEEVALRDVPLSAESDSKEEAKPNHQESNEIVILLDQETTNSSPSSADSSSEQLDKTTEVFDSDLETHLVHPPAHLPQPEAPQGLLTKARSTGPEEAHLPQPETLRGVLTKARSTGPKESRQIERSVSASSDSSSSSPVYTIGKFFKNRSNSLSSAITKHISALREPSSPSSRITEFQLSGLKVVVNVKDDNSEENDGPSLHHSPINNISGRISFFSRSGCRDCTAVRSFFRDKGLQYVEINIDVFPEREKELTERTGSSAVPQIFFNEKLLGGLVVLNSLRNSGEFDRRVMEMAGRRCPDTAPRVPVYGFDNEEEVKRQKVDAMAGIVRVLRHRLPVQDRLVKMKILKNCFSGSEMVEEIIPELDCGRKKAIEIGKELARRHFIHHVFRENDFEDGHHQFYRFLEHDPAIPKCFNFIGATNDNEPKSASVIGHRLTKLMSAMLEAYASDDRRHLDYARIAASEEFRRYVNLVQDLQRVDIFTLSVDETLAFFLNLYNAMVIHAVIKVGRPGVIDRRAFFSDFQYIVGGYPYSLSTIKNGILRSNRRQPYSFTKPFSSGDKRLEAALPKVNPLIHFGLCNGARSSPTVRFFSAQGVELELRNAARELFVNGGIEVDLSKRTVHLTRIIKWYDADFGQEKEMLKWILNYLDATKAGLLTHLLNDGGHVNVAYQNFDWSLNS